MGKIFSPELIIEYFPEVLAGVPETLFIFITVVVISMVFAVIGAVIRIKSVPVLTQILSVLASYTANVPSIIQLYIIFYILPALLNDFFGINANDWEPLVYVIIAFGIQRGVSLMEGLRAAILAVPNGQYDAAYAMGLSRSQTFFRIIFPQAFRIVLPVFEMISTTLIKRTAVAYMIGCTDVMSRAIFAGGRIGHNLEAYIAATIIFFAMDLVIIGIFHLLEKKYSFGIADTV